MGEQKLVQEYVASSIFDHLRGRGPLRHLAAQLISHTTGKAATASSSSTNIIVNTTSHTEIPATAVRTCSIRCIVHSHPTAMKILSIQLAYVFSATVVSLRPGTVTKTNSQPAATIGINSLLPLN